MGVVFIPLYLVSASPTPPLVPFRPSSCVAVCCVISGNSGTGECFGAHTTGAVWYSMGAVWYSMGAVSYSMGAVQCSDCCCVGWTLLLSTSCLVTASALFAVLKPESCRIAPQPACHALQYCSLHLCLAGNFPVGRERLGQGGATRSFEKQHKFVPASHALCKQAS